MFIIPLNKLLPLVKCKEEAETIVRLSLSITKLKAYVRGYVAVVKHQNVSIIEAKHWYDSLCIPW